MVILSDGLRWMHNNAGRTLRVRYYTNSPGSVWDDENVWTQSGTDLYISGAVLKIDSSRGSEDAVLLEQGRIRYDDTKLYVNGSIQTNSGNRVFTMTVSGLNRVYQELPVGVYTPQYLGTDIMKKVYVRETHLGSLT